METGTKILIASGLVLVAGVAIYDHYATAMVPAPAPSQNPNPPPPPPTATGPQNSAPLKIIQAVWQLDGSRIYSSTFQAAGLPIPYQATQAKIITWADGINADVTTQLQGLAKNNSIYVDPGGMQNIFGTLGYPTFPKQLLVNYKIGNNTYTGTIKDTQALNINSNLS